MISLHDAAQWLGFAVTIGSLWRFVIKPLFDERETTREWRRDMDARVKLLEKHQPPEDAELRDRLVEGRL